MVDNSRTAASVPAAASGFFTDSKKGEVNELKEVSRYSDLLQLYFAS
jgi:hypothetical protein